MTKSTKFDVDFCTVLCLHKGELYFAERVGTGATERRIADDIASGQIENACAVFQFNPGEGHSREISDDVARTVLNIVLDDDGDIPEHVVDFLETHIGCRAVAEIAREYS
jgi:hypothetical protein